MSGRLLPVVLALAVAGCATTRPPAVLLPPGQAQALQDEREARLAGDRDWGLEGRIAVSNGRDAGSGRIEWRQDGERFDIVLTAPITGQGWRLSGAPGRATLDGLPGGPRQGDDAETLLREATGWDIPVQALPAWVRGLRADPSATVAEFGGDGRLARLSERGWTITYAWPAADAVLPSRIEARRGDARVRLVVDRWTDAAAP